MPRLDDPAIHQGVQAYNDFLARTWAGRQEEMARLAVAAVGDLTDDPRIRRVDKVELEVDRPPQLAIQPQGADEALVQLRLPGSGHWRLFVQLRARVRKIFGFHTYKLEVPRLRVTATLRVRWTPGRPFDLVRSQVRVTLGDFDVDSTNVAMDLLAEAFEPFAARWLKKQIQRALEDAIPKASRVEALRALGIGSNPPPLPAPAAPARLLDRARELSRRIQADHLPFETLLSAWLAGPDATDPVETYIHFGDSAIWTGHYLAAEAARFAATDAAAEKDEAAANALRALRGFDTLVRLTEDDGLLSRVLVRADSPHARVFREREEERGHGDRIFPATVDGVDYLSQGHITRDQYAGAFLGAGLAHRLIDRPPVRELAADLGRRMAGYLAERDFCPTEVAVDPELGLKPTSVTYFNAPAQAMTIARLGAELAPGRHGDLWRRLRPMASILWLFQGLQSLDPHRRYFRFNLEHTMALLLLVLEGEAAGVRELGEGLQVLRRALASHQNAWFDAVELAGFEADDDALARPRAEIADELHRSVSWLVERSEVMEDVDLTGQVDTVTYQDLSGDKEHTAARNPVPVPDRPGTDFLWQRSPFLVENELDVFPDRAIRPPGVDFLLPYWLGRLVGAIPAA